MKLNGIYIAPVTPVSEDWSIDWARYEKLLSFLLERGVDGFCIGGGTSEYIHFSVEERKKLFDVASAMIPGDKKIFAAVGASSFSQAVELGRFADKLEVDAVLLPMPHFFTYLQGDLEEFCRQVSRSLDSPVLLYNLPFFTNPLDYETTARLLRDEEGIIGIKDSSGEADRFDRYVKDFPENSDKEINLMIGQDPFAFDALESGWTGIISGLGTVCPELLVCLYRSFKRGDFEKAKKCQQIIRDMNDHISALPVPWAIRFGLECRGMDCGAVSLPLSAERKEQKQNYQVWFKDWLEKYSDVWQN
jgi:dihydrodipicolinate synthase/N-acetylneuraminate lyase